jgi:hypothetical protein
MKNRQFLSLLVVFFFAFQTGFPNDTSSRSLMRSDADSTILSSAEQLTPQPNYHNAWGLDILVSNDGFGLGTFYRREFTEDLFGFAMFSISESKDEREFEQYDYYSGVSYVPGKLQRFMVLPLTFGLQYRLFREDITDNFRPFVNAGAGPTMIYSSPFAEITILRDPNGNPISTQSNQIEFFPSS